MFIEANILDETLNVLAQFCFFFFVHKILQGCQHWASAWHLSACGYDRECTLETEKGQSVYV